MFARACAWLVRNTVYYVLVTPTTVIFHGAGHAGSYAAPTKIIAAQQCVQMMLPFSFSNAVANKKIIARQCIQMLLPFSFGAAVAICPTHGSPGDALYPSQLSQHVIDSPKAKESAHEDLSATLPREFDRTVKSTIARMEKETYVLGRGFSANARSVI